jgi:hypothetical protein
MVSHSSLRSLLLALTLLGIATPVLRAQDDPQPISTLHVYMDLIQVPVLVLDSSHKRMQPIAPAKFRVSLDSGKLFSPQHVRQQGDDPISLTILLDATGQQAELMPRLDALIAGLASNSLHPIDRVTVFAMDCRLVRSINDAPATPDRLRGAVDAALKDWRIRTEEQKACDKYVPLWDSMALAMQQLAKLPGRRILLAVTGGYDHGSSSVDWADLKDLAQAKSISIFGLAPNIPPVNLSPEGRIADAKGPTTEDPFNMLCQLTGGIVLRTRFEDLNHQLNEVVAMVRERYILEFVRPRNDSAGKHSIDISLVRTLAFIRPAGVGYGVLDPAVANDPNTIPRDTTNAPEEGKRKILTPH